RDRRRPDREESPGRRQPALQVLQLRAHPGGPAGGPGARRRPEQPVPQTLHDFLLSRCSGHGRRPPPWTPLPFPYPLRGGAEVLQDKVRKVGQRWWGDVTDGGLGEPLSMSDAGTVASWRTRTGDIAGRASDSHRRPLRVRHFRRAAWRTRPTPVNGTSRAPLVEERGPSYRSRSAVTC